MNISIFVAISLYVLIFVHASCYGIINGAKALLKGYKGDIRALLVMVNNRNERLKIASISLNSDYTVKNPVEEALRCTHGKGLSDTFKSNRNKSKLKHRTDRNFHGQNPSTRSTSPEANQSTSLSYIPLYNSKNRHSSKYNPFSSSPSKHLFKRCSSSQEPNPYECNR